MEGKRNSAPSQESVARGPFFFLISRCIQSSCQLLLLQQVCFGLMLAVFLAALDQVSFSYLHNQNITHSAVSIDNRCYSFANYRSETRRRTKLQLGWQVTKTLLNITSFSETRAIVHIYLLPLGKVYLGPAASLRNQQF